LSVSANTPSENSSELAKSNRALRVGKIREVSSIVKMAPSTIRAKMRAGEFPASVRLSYKLAVWNLDEIEAWFQEKLNTAPVYVPRVCVPKSNGFAVAEVANG
jgi:predicted DNA-binding transcriptional regulator AlpA